MFAYIFYQEVLLVNRACRFRYNRTMILLCIEAGLDPIIRFYPPYATHENNKRCSHFLHLQTNSPKHLPNITPNNPRLTLHDLPYIITRLDVKYSVPSI